MAKVDCTQNHDLCTRNDVRGFPTLIGFADGNPDEKRSYQGARTLEALSMWIDENTPKALNTTVVPALVDEPAGVAEPALPPTAADAAAAAQPAGRGLGANAPPPAGPVGVDGAAAAALLAVAEDRARAATAEVARLRRELQREKEEHAACLATIRRVEDALLSGHAGLAAHGGHR